MSKVNGHRRNLRNLDLIASGDGIYDDASGDGGPPDGKGSGHTGDDTTTDDGSDHEGGQKGQPWTKLAAKLDEDMIVVNATFLDLQTLMIELENKVYVLESIVLPKSAKSSKKRK